MRSSDTRAGIGDHGLLANGHGAALVTRDGTIDWACLPRFDSPAVFAELLGQGAGHWSLRPCDQGATATRRYLDGRSGAMAFRTELALRPEFGLVTPRHHRRQGGLLARGGATAFTVDSAVDLGLGTTPSATFTVEAGDRLAFDVRLCDPWTDPPAPRTQEDLAAIADDTAAAWRSWSGLHQSYDGAYHELVRHSGRVLQALTYAPSGAIVAAPTTSLPEVAGGSRNWDYRFSWVRDASLTMEALWVAACPDEAEDFFAFFATAAGTDLRDGRPLPIMYGIGGERHLPEVELDHLGGFADSRPVRVGNGAWDQVQLDVYGELLGAACRLADQLGGFSADTAAFLVELADAAAAHWTDADQGIWEVRGGPRHFTYSKLMCWVALDRAVALADRIGGEDRVEAWEATRDEIHRTIIDRCWSPSAEAYAQSYDSDLLDASVLMMLIVGFLAPDDPRARSTVEAIADHLTDPHGFVFRYLDDDGMEGEEGTFAICTFWLSHCWALLGEVDRARALFDRLTACANDLGLLAEEIDPATGDMLGNFPQAFTHIGLVNAAWAIHQAEQASGRPAR